MASAAGDGVASAPHLLPGFHAHQVPLDRGYREPHVPVWNQSTPKPEWRAGVEADLVGQETAAPTTFSAASAMSPLHGATLRELASCSGAPRAAVGPLHSRRPAGP